VEQEQSTDAGDPALDASAKKMRNLNKKVGSIHATPFFPLLTLATV
jgi:hypothetical protein